MPDNTKTNSNRKNLNTNQEKGFVVSALIIAIPSMIAFMTDYSYQLVDTYWVSQLGQGFPTAMLIAVVMLRLFNSLNNIVSSSTIPIFSQTFGSGDKERTGYVILQGIMFKLALGILAGVLYLIVANNLMFLFTDDPFVTEKAKEYANIVFLSLIIIFPFGSVLTGLRSINEAGKTLIISIISLVFNLILDPILIYGVGFVDPLLKILGMKTFESVGMASFMKYGISGAAIATILTQILGFIIASIFLVKNREKIEVFKMRNVKFDPDLYKKMLTIGLPAGGVTMVWNINQFIITSIITGYGLIISDGYGIAQRIRGLFFMGLFGLSLGAAITCGKFIGAGKSDTIKKRMNKLVVSSVFLMSFVCVPVFIFSKSIIGLFLDVPGSIEYGSMFLRFFAVTLLLVCGKFIFESPFKGAGRNVPLFIMNSIMLILVEVSIVLLIRFVFNLDVFYIALAILVTNALSLFAMYRLFKSDMWMKNTLTT